MKCQYLDTVTINNPKGRRFSDKQVDALFYDNDDGTTTFVFEVTERYVRDKWSTLPLKQTSITCELGTYDIKDYSFLPKRPKKMICTTQKASQ